MRARTRVIAIISGALGGVVGSLAVQGIWWPLAIWLVVWSVLLVRYRRADRQMWEEEMRLLSIERSRALAQRHAEMNENEEA